MNWKLWIAALGLCLVSSAVMAADGEYRTWTDSTGKFKIKAKILSLKDDVVTLERDNGTEIQLPLKKLSTADQAIAKKSLEDGDSPATPKGPSAADPFEAAKKRAAGRGGRRGNVFGTRANNDKAKPPRVDFEVPDDSEVKTVDAPITGATQVSLFASSSAGWKIAVPAPPKEATLGAIPRNVSIPPRQQYEHLQRMAINPTAKKALLGYYLENPWEKTKLARIYIADFATGKGMNSSPLPSRYLPIAISNDGKLMLIHKFPVDWHTGEHTCELWKMEDKTITRTSWVPFAGDRHADIGWGEFVGNDKILLSGNSGTVGCWKVDGLQPLFLVNTTSNAVPAISPDQRLLALSDGSRLSLLDIEKHEIVASAPISKTLDRPYLAFSPSGKQIGCVASHRLMMWETATGKLIGEMEHDGSASISPMQIPSDNYILGGTHYLFNLADQAQVWQYNSHDNLITAGGYSFVAVNPSDASRNGLFVPVDIPHKGVKDFQERSKKDPTFHVLREGSVVKLDVSQLPDAGERAKVAAALTANLEKGKCSVGDNGTITLQATFEGPKAKTLAYVGAGSHQFQAIDYGLKFVYEGVAVWQSSSSNVPYTVYQGRDQTFEMALRTHEKATYTWYGEVVLPRYLQKPASRRWGGRNITIPQHQSGFGLGESQITINGIVDR